MTFVIDNGMQYTGHRFYFIDCEDQRALQLACNRANARHSGYSYKIVASAPDMTLFNVTALTLEAFVEDCDAEPLEDWERDLNDVPEDADI